MTWFRREADITWFAGFGDEAPIQAQVLEWLWRARPDTAGAALPAARPASLL
jgi:hypothetical protein